jgi:hypothetical protein
MTPKAAPLKPSPHCAPVHTNPKRKRGSYADLPRWRFGLVWRHSVARFRGPVRNAG